MGNMNNNNNNRRYNSYGYNVNNNSRRNNYEPQNRGGYSNNYNQDVDNSFPMHSHDMNNSVDRYNRYNDSSSYNNDVSSYNSNQYNDFDSKSSYNGFKTRQDNNYSENKPFYDEGWDTGYGNSEQENNSRMNKTVSFEQLIPDMEREGIYFVPSYNLSSLDDVKALDSGNEAAGILEIMPDRDYGFIRCNNYTPSNDDVYVYGSQIRKYNLKNGDYITGNKKVQTNEKFTPLLYLKTVNGKKALDAITRESFENLTPIFPTERIRLERPNGPLSMRLVDLIAPIGKGQRGLIVSPPKAGKTTLLKHIAESVLINNDNKCDDKIHLMILLIDERPEEVTDIKEYLEKYDNVEIIYSTFDEQVDHHKRISEIVIERAKRLVEYKQDVMILTDSITRLARAYNLLTPPSGKTLSGGLDPLALYHPKHFFGAARNMKEGGSLTILATALIDTGSKMDDVIFEEFKGTGNMELVLDRELSEKRIFPAIDVLKSGTRKENLLLSVDEQEVTSILRRHLNDGDIDNTIEKLKESLTNSETNQQFLDNVKAHLKN